MKNVLYLDGLQGRNTLIEFLKYEKDILVVIPEDFPNEEIEKVCNLNNLEFVVRKKNIPLDLSNLEVKLIISSQFQYKILPQEYLQAENALNLHASILPAYKGKHSDVWSLINDERQLGMTVHRLNEKFDDGEILHIELVEIDDSMSLEKIYEKVSNTIPKVVGMIVTESIFSSPKPIERPDTFWRIRGLQDSIINWHLSARKIFLFVRALSRPPIFAYSYYKQVKYSFKEVIPVKVKIDAIPGTVISHENKICVVCGDGNLVEPLSVSNDNNQPLKEGMVLH